MKKASPPVLQATAHARAFACAGPSCPDTCCSGWTIDVDAATHRKYVAEPELADSFNIHESESEPDGVLYAMRCEGAKGLCVVNRDGWCGIQEQFGAEYLSDTCFFFPRAIRKLGGKHYMGLSLSCPESARLALFANAGTNRAGITSARALPHIYDYSLPALDDSAPYALHERIINALADDTLSPEQHMARLIRLTYAMSEADYDSWPALTGFYARSPAPPPANADACNELPALVHSLLQLAISHNTQYRPRFYETLRDMEKTLHLSLHWKEGTMQTSPDTAAACKEIWRHNIAAPYAQPLRQWLRIQAANSLYPFQLIGENLRERAVVFGLHFATVRLGLICATIRHGATLPESEVLRVAQSVARLFDHMVNINTFRERYPHQNWHNESVLCAMVGHVAEATPPNGVSLPAG